MLVISLTLMTGCSSSDGDSTSDTANNEVVSSQTSVTESNSAVRAVSSQTLAPESDFADKVVNSQASATASVLSDVAALGITSDDLSKSKGTDQDVIVALVPTPEQENVPRYTKIEVTFSVPLDVSAIQEHNVKLTYLSSKTNDHIAGVISYSAADKKLTFTPNDLLEPVLYEVEIKSLKAEKAYKDVKINEIKYRFNVVEELLGSIVIFPETIDLMEGTSLQLGATGYYDNDIEKNITAQAEWSVADTQIATVDSNATLRTVKEGTTKLTAKIGAVEANVNVVVYMEINGYRLPPEPDPAVNNATLLGVDSNANGVRDDVERKIYLNYDKEVTRQMLMQSARVNQKMLADPELEKNAFYWVGEPKKRRIGCKVYIFRTYDIDLFHYATENDIYNTKDRIQKYMQYNQALSGGVYTTEELYTSESSCDFNITKALAADQ